ncbi:MAG: ABC transporter permease subunit, partial [Tepidanaerobacteraceae bacterium]
MGINFAANKVLASIPYLLGGVWITLQITVLALALSTVLGILVSLLRVYGKGIFHRFSLIYSRLMRSLPLLVILFMLYFLGSEI